jgi:hypothetical protein
MPVEINTQIIHASYATVINRIDPDAHIYDNPNQQGSELPAWFIVHRAPVDIHKEGGKINHGSRFLVTYSIDIWYMLKQNITRLYDQYTEIAERLDTELEYLPVFNSNAVLHVHDRTWSLEMNALKYSTTLKFYVYTNNPDAADYPKVDVITGPDVFLKNQSESFITFTNEDHPEFDVSFPTSLSTKTGNKINLPSVSGSFVDDEHTWKPDSWSIGKFGELVKVDENMTANLVWVGESRLAQVSFVNTEYPQFDVVLPEPAFVLKGSVYELPSVSGSFDDGTFKYTPTAWSIGAFGESVVVDTDIVVELVWNKQQLKYTGYPTSAGNTPKDVTVRYYTSYLYDENGNPIQTTQRIGSATAYTVNGGQVYGFKSLVVDNGFIKILYNMNYTWITIHHIEYTLI